VLLMLNLGRRRRVNCELSLAPHTRHRQHQDLRLMQCAKAAVLYLLWSHHGCQVMLQKGLGDGSYPGGALGVACIHSGMGWRHRK